eukprot:11456348-Prorocentrum_lima.AAC.1
MEDIGGVEAATAILKTTAALHQPPPGLAISLSEAIPEPPPRDGTKLAPKGSSPVPLIDLLESDDYMD